jgi:hypothetical protein
MPGAEILTLNFLPHKIRSGRYGAAESAVPRRRKASKDSNTKGSKRNTMLKHRVPFVQCDSPLSARRDRND